MLKGYNVVVNKNSFDSVCVACQKGKVHKLPFSNSNTIYTFPFELVVSDFWGPVVVDCNGHWYYVNANLKQSIVLFNSRN